MHFSFANICTGVIFSLKKKYASVLMRVRMHYADTRQGDVFNMVQISKKFSCYCGWVKAK